MIESTCGDLIADLCAWHQLSARELAAILGRRRTSR
jgi:hypothetical protein